MSALQLKDILSFCAAQSVYLLARGSWKSLFQFCKKQSSYGTGSCTKFLIFAS